MNLLEHSLWWIVPAFGIAAFMVVAMMNFTLLLMVRPPRRRRQPVEGAALRQRLLALNGPGRPWRLVEGGPGDLEFQWEVVDAAWRELFANVKLSSRYHAQLLLDEERRRLRFYESLRTASWFIGFDGYRPRFSGAVEWRWGYVDMVWRGVAYGILPGFPPRIGQVHAFELDTVGLKNTIAEVAGKAGWEFRPALHPLAVNRRWAGRLRALRPDWMDRVDERWRWGGLYVGSFALFYLYVLVGFLNAEAGDYSWTKLWPAVVVAVGWWATWGGLAWLLAGTFTFWRTRQIARRRGKRAA